MIGKIITKLIEINKLIDATIRLIILILVRRSEEK